MTILTLEAATLIASLCGGPNVDPKFLAIIARQESSLRVETVGPKNSDGTHDYGITGINEKNFVFLNVDAAALIDQTDINIDGHAVPKGACVAFRAQGDLLRVLARYNTGRTGTQAGQSYAAGVLRVGSRTPTIAASDPASMPPNLITRPIRSGRDLLAPRQ